MEKHLRFDRFTNVQSYPFMGTKEPEVICLVTSPGPGNQILLLEDRGTYAFPTGSRTKEDQLLSGWSSRTLLHHGITETHLSLRSRQSFLGERLAGETHLILVFVQLCTKRGLADAHWVDSYGHLFARVGKMCIQDPQRFAFIRDGANMLFERGDVGWHWGLYE